MRVVPQIPTWFKNFEVPHGLDVDYGPSLAYDGLRLLRSPSLDQWSLFGSEWIAQTAAEFMLTLFGSFQLFRLPDTLVEYIRLLDLSFILGNKETYQELLTHLDLVHRLDWTSVPADNVEPWSSREGLDLSPCTIEGATLIWYDPFTKKALSEEEAQYRVVSSHSWIWTWTNHCSLQPSGLPCLLYTSDAADD